MRLRSCLFDQRDFGLFGDEHLQRNSCRAFNANNVHLSIMPAAGGGSFRRRTTPTHSSSCRRWARTLGLALGMFTRRSVKHLGPSSNSHTTSSVQRSPTRSRAWAAHPSSYVRLVAMPKISQPEVLIRIYLDVFTNLLVVF